MIEEEFSNYMKRPLKKQKLTLTEVSHDLNDYKLLYDNVNLKTKQKIEDQKKLINTILQINNNIDNLEKKNNYL